MPPPVPQREAERLIELWLVNAGAYSDDLANALFEAFDGGVEYGTRGDLTYIGVYMARPDWWRDLPQAVERVRALLPEAELVRLEVEPGQHAQAA